MEACSPRCTSKEIEAEVEINIVILSEKQHRNKLGKMHLYKYCLCKRNTERLPKREGRGEKSVREARYVSKGSLLED